ncbi:MAG: hypothetical protein JO257_12725 [Deltaproteobacteria bacterium]|nr:hypothetical protein [Deltaproteobacteria bacterium]
MQNRPRPLYVPDLSRPCGADIAPDGTIQCVACDRRVPVGDADIVGKGYRCARCSALATPEDDVDASLKPSEKALVPEVPPPRRFAIAGVVLLAIAVLMWVTGFDLSWGYHYKRSLFMYVGIASIGCFALALARHRTWQ